MLNIDGAYEGHGVLLITESTMLCASNNTMFNTKTAGTEKHLALQNGIEIFLDKPVLPSFQIVDIIQHGQQPHSDMPSPRSTEAACFQRSSRRSVVRLNNRSKLTMLQTCHYSFPHSHSGPLGFGFEC